MTKETVDVEAIDILLIGNEEEIAAGIRRIDRYFRGKIVEIIRKKALSAKEHNLSDIYQNVIKSIWEYAREGNYNPDAQKLEGFIYTIAYRRAVDWIREKYDIIEDHNTDAVVESTKEIICGSKYNQPWQEAQYKEKRSIILETIQYLIPKLKHRQRQVAEIILMNFPDFLDLLDIKKHILKHYGENVTVLAIKRARQEVYNKIKEALSIAGYGDYIDD